MTPTRTIAAIAGIALALGATYLVSVGMTLAVINRNDVAGAIQ